MVFCLLVKVILSKDKLKILIISMSFSVQLYTVQGQLSLNIFRAFNWCAESSKWHNPYFIAHTCICIAFLTRMVRRLFKINSTAFIALLDKRTFLPTFSTFGLLMSKKDLGLLRWCKGKESTYQCVRSRRHRFDPWVRKIPWRRIWQPTRVFLSGKFHGQRSLEGYSP